MNAQSEAFLKLVRDPLRSRIFLFLKLPSAYFSGVRVVHASNDLCKVAVPYTWFSKNPFRSTYFACLSMAAEMSTGLLAMASVYKRNPKVSMLVIKQEAFYYKKATGKTIFTCTQGKEITEAVARAITTGDAQTINVTSTGINGNNETVAVFQFTWSFKAKT